MSECKGCLACAASTSAVIAIPFEGANSPKLRNRISGQFTRMTSMSLEIEGALVGATKVQPANVIGHDENGTWLFALATLT